MDLKILNAEHYILSVNREAFPLCYHGSMIILYLPQVDAIVLNDDMNALDKVVEIIAGYLSANDIQRKIYVEEAANHTTAAIEMVQFVNKVARTRRKLYHNMKK